MSEAEKLFNRFMKLKNEVQSMAAIVQNPMTLSEQEINSWDQESVERFRKDFEYLISDVKEFYQK